MNKEEANKKRSEAMMGNKNRLGYIAPDHVRRRMSAAMRRKHRERKTPTLG